MTFTIHGAPRTKKGHVRIIRVKGRPRIVQAQSHDAWADAAILQCRSQMASVSTVTAVDRRPGRESITVDWRRGKRIDAPVNLRALIYRDRAVGDLGNYLAAICDVLERAGVVVNDKFITQFDGSRLLVDRHAPRVEIELTQVVS